MQRPLTGRQREILGFIRDFVEREGVPPTVREIASHFGFSSPLAAQLHIAALLKKGYLEKTALKTRNLRVIGLDSTGGRNIPLVGRVRAGDPILALEETGERITVDRTLMQHSDAFALRITGDSMIEAGILEGDIVIVTPDKSPRDGSVAVVLIGDEVTVKRFFREGSTVRLVPANAALVPAAFDARDVQVIGRVVGLVRRL